MGVLELRANGGVAPEIAGTSTQEQGMEAPKAFAWGVGEDGQLGQGTLEDEHWPTPVSPLDGLELEQLVAGSRNSLAITKQGRVYTWGWNQRGTLGFAGENKAESEPQELTGLAGKKIVQATIGGWHCLAVDDTGQAYCWGGNEYGQCGLPVEKLYVGSRFVKKDIAPPRPCAAGLKVRTVSAGGMHSLILTMEGEVWTWGQPLVATGYFDVWKPHKVIGVPHAVSAVAGAFHNLALTSAGEVLAWGNGGYGQLGQGDTHNRPNPSVVQGLKGLRICQLAAGGWHSAALTEDGQLYMWGRGEHGRLGLGTDNKDKLQPMRVEPLAGEHVRHVSCGGSHSAALTKDGRLYVMGRGEFGRLGHGSTKTSNRPVLVTVGPGPRSADNSPDARRVSFSRVAFDGTNSDSESETPRRPDDEAAVRPSVNGESVNRDGSWGVVGVTCGGRHTLALAQPGWPKSMFEGPLQGAQKAGEAWAVEEGKEGEEGKGPAESRGEGAEADGEGEPAGLAPDTESVAVDSDAPLTGDGVHSAPQERHVDQKTPGSAPLLQEADGRGTHTSQPVNVPGRTAHPASASNEITQSAPEGSGGIPREDEAAGPKPETCAPASTVRTQTPHREHRQSPMRGAGGAAHHGHRTSFLSDDEDGDHDVDDVSSLGSQPGDRSSPLSILETHDVPGCLEAWVCNRQRGQWPEEVGIKGKQLKEDLKLAGIIPEDVSDAG